MSGEFSDQRLSAYLDGELSADERAAVESLVASDPAARQLFDELRELSREVRQLPGCSASEGFAQRVVQAALAAKAEQNGSIQPATRGKSSSRPAWWAATVAGAGALAASLLLVAWSQGLIGPHAGAGPVVKVPGTITQPADSPAQIAVARLRQAIPQEGEAVVIRLRLDAGQSPSQALDAAFTAAGIGSRLASDASTGAMSVAKAYRDRLAEKFGGQQPGVANTALTEATSPAADAVFVEAPLEAVEQALAALAAQPKSDLKLSPLMSVAITRSPTDNGGNAQGETGPNEVAAGPKHYAQRLNAGLFRLEKKAAESAATPAGPLDAKRPVRVLILIERP